MKGLGRNVLSLAGGNIVAQLISLLAVPVITRLYSITEFGVFSTYMSVVLMLVPISTLRLNSALVVAEARAHAENLLVLSLAAVSVVTIIISIVVFILSMYSAGGVLQDYLWLIPINVFLLGAVLSIQFWLLRLKNFNTIAYSQITESVTDRSTVIGLGLLGSMGPIGIISGRILGPLLNVLVLCTHLTRSVGWPSLRAINLQTLWQTLNRFRDFPLFSSWAFLATSAAREAPVLIIAVLFSPAVAGLYGLGLRVLNMPMLMVGDALSKVLLARVREHRDDHELLAGSLLRIFALVTYPGMLLMLIMLAAGPDLFSYVFGVEWKDAGAFAAVLSPAIMLMLNYRITSVLFDLYERQRQRMIFDVGLLLVRVVSLVAANMMGMTILHALAVMMISSSILYAGGIVYLFSLLHIHFSVVLSRLLRNAILVTPSLIGVLTIYFYNFTEVKLLFSLIMMCVIQLFIVLYFDKSLFSKKAK